MGCVSVKKREEPISQLTKVPVTNVNVYIDDEKDLQILRKPRFNESYRIVFDQPFNQMEKVQKKSQPKIVRQKQSKPVLQNIGAQRQYRQKLSEEVFQLVENLPNSLIKCTVNTSLKFPRLQKEMSKFTSMLPCEQTHSIFVRCDTAKIYSINALISGSKGTPYAHGLYHFEINCFDNYPNSPPKVSLLTGRYKVRFNPNLYQSGYVCLSLLGTWSGQGCQTWNPQKSNLAQVLLSIQSLIMSDDIYFNQPGYESTKGTPNGKLRNTSYSNIVKIANIRYAMIQIMKHPPKGFEKVVRNHFLIKRDEILSDCNKWLQQKDENFVNCGQNPNIQTNMSTPLQYGQNLKSAIDQLKTALSLLSQS